jgi:hypothetical protein
MQRKKKVDDQLGPGAPVPAVSYYNIFQSNPDGQKILDELSRLYYDRSSITNPVDANATLVLEGQRQVVLWIIQKCAEGQK